MDRKPLIAILSRLPDEAALKNYSLVCHVCQIIWGKVVSGESDLLRLARVVAKAEKGQQMGQGDETLTQAREQFDKRNEQVNSLRGQ